jgi:hypothetical protein
MVGGILRFFTDKKKIEIFFSTDFFPKSEPRVVSGMINLAVKIKTQKIYTISYG